jgi:hypothetical protein
MRTHTLSVSLLAASLAPMACRKGGTPPPTITFAPATQGLWAAHCASSPREVRFEATMMDMYPKRISAGDQLVRFECVSRIAGGTAGNLQIDYGEKSRVVAGFWVADEGPARPTPGTPTLADRMLQLLSPVLPESEASKTELALSTCNALKLDDNDMPYQLEVECRDLGEKQEREIHFRMTR